MRTRGGGRGWYLHSPIILECLQHVLVLEQTGNSRGRALRGGGIGEDQTGLHTGIEPQEGEGGVGPHQQVVSELGLRLQGILEDKG